MTKHEILNNYYNHKEVKLTHQCKVENGIMDDEQFTILNVMDFTKLDIVNQYNQKYTINPNQLKN